MSVKVMRRTTPEPIRFSQQSNTVNRKCAECKDEEKLQPKARSGEDEENVLMKSENDEYTGMEAPSIVHDVISNSEGKSLDQETRSFMEPRFGYDFSRVRIHDNSIAAKSAGSINALAFTSGNDVVFNSGQYNTNSDSGKRLLAHELTHVMQQSQSIVNPKIQLQRKKDPYIKKIIVTLTPPQHADMEWEGSPPESASGSDSFTVSTGKGYSDPDDPRGTCTRTCCANAETQCAPPFNKPTSVGSCCTYYGSDFYTGKPLDEHNSWKYWTPIQPYYSTRGIALHQHSEVTGEPIGHGCVRMAEGNAKRIFDFSRGRNTNVTMVGRAAPVKCNDEHKCAKTHGSLSEGNKDNVLAIENASIQGLEGEIG